MTRSTARAAFTLIELLVAIAIIAILMTLLSPVLRAVRQNMRGAQCVNNLKQIHASFQQYHQDYKRLPPTDQQIPGVPAYNATWIQGPGVDLPTRFSDTSLRNSLLWKYNQTREIRVCPMDTDNTNGFFSYSMSSILGMKTFNEVFRPAEALLLVQENPLRFIGTSNGDGTFMGTDEPDVIHNGMAGTLYVDGHAALYDWTQYIGPPKPYTVFNRPPAEIGTIPPALKVYIMPWGNLSGPATGMSF
jgi:prepilin-type N-terminal cleavage/methylation domain-containing protein/prepilin-type processing-associated H-X9-DG protein